MKLKLNKKELFWAMIDPMDLEKVLVVLNESNPTEDVDFEKLPAWAKKQIMSSAQAKRISTEPELDLEVESKTNKKVVAKKVVKKATSKN